MPNFTPTSSEGVFHDFGGETHTGRFSNAFYGHLWAFSLGAKRDDAVFSVARLPVRNFGLGAMIWEMCAVN